MLKNKNTLQNAMNSGRSLNLNFLRFMAALLVIFSHAFPLSLGKMYGDFMVDFSGGKLGLGGIAVGVFFLSSGLLVSKSAERNSNIFRYFKARCLRIFPALISVVLCCVFLLGPFITTMNFNNYFLNPSTYLYMLNGLLVPIHSLPGVFQDNIYGSVINGALWTMPLEFLCYIGLFIFYKMNILTKKNIKFTMVPACIAFYIFYYSNIPLLNALNIYVQPIFIFYIGMCFYVYRDCIKLSRELALIFSIIWIGLVKLGFSEIAMVFLFPYIILVFIYDQKQCSLKLSKLGGFSYGIYLVGFPIQQLVVQMFGGKMNPYFNTIISIPIACLLGVLIFYFVEKTTLKKFS